MKRIRIGNDFTITRTVVSGGNPEDLVNISNPKMELISFFAVPTVNPPYTISNVNKIDVNIEAQYVPKVGKYKLVFSYEVADANFTDGFRKTSIDVAKFEIVSEDSQADSCNDVAESGQIEVGIKGEKGDSAFTVWQLQAGNDGKTYDDYFDYLRAPAADAVDSANTAATNANTAATNANTATGLAIAAKDDYYNIVKPEIISQGEYATAQGDYAKAQGEAVEGAITDLQTNSEIKSNKTSDIESNKTSTDKYPNVKGVNDWSLSKFPLKGVVFDYIALYSRKIATVVNGVITAIQETIDAHNSRVTADSGTIRTQSLVKRYYDFCYDNQMFDSIKFAWLGDGGSKFRTSGIYTFFTKIYSMLGGNDASQMTSTSQPYLSGNIAPNEKYGLKNPNGGNNSMTHPEISFAAADAWSVSTIINNFGTNVSIGILFGGPAINISTIYFARDSGALQIYNSLGNSVDTITTFKQFIGKSIIITFVANGNGTLKLYINGVYIETLNIITSFIFRGIFSASDSSKIAGKSYAHTIRSQALTQEQVTAEYNLLRSYIPEIENVTIGTQIWATSNCEMVTTPMGNLIPNVTDNTAWASSQTLYDNAYAATSGTVEQKTYAAVKAAAMWCHYDNDVALGAVYGKLYNWFAVKLLQMDIDYYNAANPTTPWGWRVPTESDFTTLNTYLGGNSVSGGKMKVAGSTYRNAPNTGADNSSGFSLIGGGQRLHTSSFVEYNTSANLFSSTKSSDGYAVRMSTYYNNTQNAISNFQMSRGYSLRLIKN